MQFQSTFDTVEKAGKVGEKVQIIDVAKLGPALEAFKNDPNGHVSIRPKNDPNNVILKNWAKIRGQANELTDEVRQAIIGTTKCL